MVIGNDCANERAPAHIVNCTLEADVNDGKMILLQ